ncbi:MAG: hypothetical protein OEV37_03810 [Candidatus Berkelbacteria bacterium]|nr:hypothetical protein [Candidatus Berkelbacteria bacterium]
MGGFKLNKGFVITYGLVAALALAAGLYSSGTVQISADQPQATSTPTQPTGAWKSAKCSASDTSTTKKYRLTSLPAGLASSYPSGVTKVYDLRTSDSKSFRVIVNIKNLSAAASPTPPAQPSPSATSTTTNTVLSSPTATATGSAEQQSSQETEGTLSEEEDIDTMADIEEDGDTLLEEEAQDAPAVAAAATASPSATATPQAGVKYQIKVGIQNTSSGTLKTNNGTILLDIINASNQRVDTLQFNPVPELAAGKHKIIATKRFTRTADMGRLTVNLHYRYDEPNRDYPAIYPRFETCGAKVPRILALGKKPKTVKLTLKNGFNAFSIPFDAKVINTRPIRLNSNLTLFVLDYKWKKLKSGKYLNWRTQGNSQLPELWRKGGYYIYNRGNEVKLTLRQDLNPETTPVYIEHDWNLLANSNSTAKKLSELKFRVIKKSVANNNCGPNKLTSCTEIKTLKDLFTGDANTRRAYPTIFIVDKENCCANQSEAQSAFSLVTVTADNIDTVEIPAGKIFWIWLFN